MKCRICESKEITRALSLGKQPLANKYPKNKKDIKSEKKFLLNIMFCKNCKSAQIEKIIDRNLMFQDYYYLSSVNKKLQEHFKILAKKLNSSKFIVDIGSNDGILLDPLKKLNIKSIGIDPSVNVGKIANDKDLKTYISFFNKKIINKILKNYNKPDVIVASSVVTHLEKPKEFAKNIKSFLQDNGILILEIEYLYNFIKNLEYERFYFDRPFYYSASSINILFNAFNMTLYDIERINIHGGSLRLFIKNSPKVKKTLRCRKILQLEKSKLKSKTFKIFEKEILKHSNSLRKNLIKEKKLGNMIIGYGAPARVSTITNFSKIDSNHIDYIIDDSPLKQNRYTPGSHIKILPKKNNINKKLKVVVVFAYEYFRDIKNNFKNLNIKFYKPIPFKRIK